MKKIKDPMEFLSELGIEHDDGYGKIFDRYFRYLEECGVIEIADNNFDRWANSVGLSFDIWLSKGQRQFLRWFNEVKNEINTPA